MTTTTTVFGPLRAASRAVAGHCKDWVAVALPDRLVIGYGRTGHRLRCTVVPQARCQQQDPQREGQRRQHDKQAEGYQIVTGGLDPWVATFLRQAGGVPSPPAVATTSTTTTAATESSANSGGLWWELIPTTDPLKPPGRSGGCAQSLGAQALLLTLYRHLPAGCLRLADERGNALMPTDFLKKAGWL